ncbi:MAG: YciI family protein [Flavobacteriales bacterium]
MKHLITLSLFYVLSLSLHGQKTFDVTIADSTYHMKQYWFVLYTKGDSAALDSATSAATLKAHLEHQEMQGKKGLIVMAGPFGDRSNWRGLLLYDCKTEDEVEGYLKSDPFVKAGQLKYEIHPWFGAVGTRLK